MITSLVTGGSGFIGQHLVERLLADGQRVRILDIEPPTRRWDGGDYVQGSVTDSKVVREAMDGVDHVYHTAAIPHLWIPKPAMFFETNVVGTKVVFEQAVDAEVRRVVHTSSATVLIDRMIGGKPVTVDESRQTGECDLIGHYARSKWRAEQVALDFADKLPVVVVMPTLPIGPGDHHFTPPSRMLLDFVSGKNRAYADCILNIIDVRDVAAGHHLACQRGRPGQRYILNRHSLPMAAFLDCVEKLTGRRMPKWRIPGGLALGASVLMELWSTLISGKPPIAPVAGTRMGLRPVIFDSHLADVELGLSTIPLLDTLKDAIAWLIDEQHLMGEIGDLRLQLHDR